MARAMDDIKDGIESGVPGDMMGAGVSSGVGRSSRSVGTRTTLI